MKLKMVSLTVLVLALFAAHAADAHRGTNHPPQIIPSHLGLTNHNGGSTGGGFNRALTSFKGSETSTSEFHGVDQDRDRVSFSLTYPGGLPSGSSDPEFIFTRDPDFMKLVWHGPARGEGNFHVILHAADEHQAKATSIAFYFPYTQISKPVFKPIPDQTVRLGQSLSFAVELTVPNPAIQIRPESAFQGGTFDGRRFSVTPSQGGTFNLNFNAMRDGFKEATVTARITVIAPKFRPIPDQKGNVGSPLTFQVILLDANPGTVVTVQGVAGASINGTTFTWTPSQQGNFTATFNAMRNSRSEATTTAKIQVGPALGIVNDARAEDGQGNVIVCPQPGGETPLGRGDIAVTSREAHFTRDIGNWVVNEGQLVRFPVSAKLANGRYVEVLGPVHGDFVKGCFEWTLECSESGEYDLEFKILHIGDDVRMPVKLHVTESCN